MMTPFPRERNQTTSSSDDLQSSCEENNCLEDLLDFSENNSKNEELNKEGDSKKNGFISSLKEENTISENSMLDILCSNTTPDFHTHKQLFIECNASNEDTNTQTIIKTCEDCASEVKKWRRRRQNMKNSARFKRSLKIGVESLEIKRNRLQQINIRLRTENSSLKRQREILRQKLRS